MLLSVSLCLISLKKEREVRFVEEEGEKEGRKEEGLLG